MEGAAWRESRRAGAALVAALGLSCVDAAPFHCQAPDQCVMSGAQGTCEASGWCSFPDTQCESGRRYAEHAGAGFAGSCVGAAPGENPDGDDATTPGPDGGSVDGQPSMNGCNQGQRNVIDPSTGNCYMYFAGPRQWLASEGACRALQPSAHLAKSGSLAENAVIAPLAGQADVWLAGTDIAVENVWLWIDGDAIEWTNWRTGEPNDANGEDCLLLEGDNGGLWDDRACSTPLGYICERD